MTRFAEHLQVEHSALAVAIVKLVSDVPTEGTKLFSLLYDRVEHANTEQHCSPVLAQYCNSKSTSKKIAKLFRDDKKTTKKKDISNKKATI